jgi:RND superfamily putative drug exporter
MPAAATSGRAVLVSGLTVMTAAAGMTLSGSRVFTSLGLGTILVVLLAMVGSLTVLPALLATLGDRIDRGILGTLAAVLLRVLPGRPRLLVRLRDRRTLLQRATGGRSESRLWALVLRPALRYPKITALGSVAILAALAAPAFHLHTRNAGVAEFPKSLEVVRAYDSITSGFGAAAAPAVVVVRGPDVSAPAVTAAVAELGREARAAGISNGTVQTAVNASKTVARIEVPLAGNGDDERSVHALGVLRSRIIPATIGGVPGAEVAVTGETAGGADFTSAIRSHLPLVFAFVLLLTFGLMLVCFRSLVVAVTAIVLNSLSLGAAYGVITWVFQDGHLERQLHFHSDGAIVPWVPLFLFTVLFGLSMDYHVFIVSRIRELHDRGASTAEAVERGIRSTASTVTSAALVMVAVFSIFATLDMLSMKEMGVGLAAAVLLDATVIRGLLLPAAMKLLGERNWYLPRAMASLPRLDPAAERA